MVIADPETGEVQRVGTGESVFFRRDTWHHAFALGPEPLRVLELFAPPPAAGASSAYARAQPYLETARYADDAQLGALAARGAARARACACCARPTSCGGATSACSAGSSSSTEHLTAATLEIGPGEAAAPHAHGGDEVLMALDGPLWVRAWHDDAVHVFELEAEDVCYLPAGCRHEYRNAGGATGARDLRDRPELPAVTPRASAIDVGATKIAAARVDLDAGRSLAARRRRRPRPQRGARCGARRLRRAGARARRRRRRRAGIGRLRARRPGRARAQRRDDRLARRRRRRVRPLRPVAVESDVRAAAMAEARYGAGRESPTSST